MKTVIEFHELLYGDDLDHGREKRAEELLSAMEQEELSRTRCAYRALYGTDFDQDLRRVLGFGADLTANYLRRSRNV